MPIASADCEEYGCSTLDFYGGGDFEMRDVRAEVRAGKDARVSHLAEVAGLPRSTLYSLIAKGKIEARKVGACVVIPNAAARQILGIQEDAAA